MNVHEFYVKWQFVCVDLVIQKPVHDQKMEREARICNLSKMKQWSCFQCNSYMQILLLLYFMIQKVQQKTQFWLLQTRYNKTTNTSLRHGHHIPPGTLVNGVTSGGTLYQVVRVNKKLVVNLKTLVSSGAKKRVRCKLAQLRGKMTWYQMEYAKNLNNNGIKRQSAAWDQ